MTLTQRSLERALRRVGAAPLVRAAAALRRVVVLTVLSLDIWRRRRVWVPVRGNARSRDRRARNELARDLFFQEHTPGPGEIVLDVGAGAGEEVELLSSLVGDGGTVIAVEAHPVTFEALRQRCARDGLANVTPVHAAVSDAPGVVFLSDEASYLENRVVGDGRGHEVPAVTLDDLLDDLGVTHVDFLKMNIEGAELAALHGLARHAGHVDHLAVSCHDFLADRGGDASNRTAEGVRRLLEARGFAVTGRRRADRRHWTRPYLYARRNDQD